MAEPTPAHTTDPARERVIMFLAFLTSDACLRACHQFLAPERLAFDLCNLWFDEIYIPSARYLDGLKGDFSEEAARTFRASFSDDECALLERFHHFFGLRMDMLPSSPAQRALFPRSDAWNNIRKDAAHLLDELVDDPEAIRTRLVHSIQIQLGETGKRNGFTMPLWLERHTRRGGPRNPASPE